MNIHELSQYGDDTLPLQQLYKNVGSCVMNGYLGDSIDELSFDEEGKVTFSTHKDLGDRAVDSKGVVLSNSILIKQVEKGNDLTSYRLYSWDVDESKYTFLSFDSASSLNRFFEVIKGFDACLCDDISTLFQEMGLSFEPVTQVITN